MFAFFQQSKQVCFIICIFSLLLFACNNNTSVNNSTSDQNQNEQSSINHNENNESSAPQENITLTFMAPWPHEFDDRVKPFVEEAFPHITMELVESWVGTTELEELITAQEIPDILLAPSYDVLGDTGLIQPLDELVEQYNVDLSMYRDGVIDSLRVRDPEGQDNLLGLPMEDVMPTLFYNKDIFDNFGVPYPEDGITWDDMFDLAVQLTREEDGVQYRGLLRHGLEGAFHQLSTTLTDPETAEVQIETNDELTQFFNLIDNFRNIPEMFQEEDPWELFHIGEAAMANLSITDLNHIHNDEGNNVNFDVIAFPEWEHLPNIRPNFSPLSVTLSPYSEHLEEAFQVIAFLTSPEHQVKLHRAGSPSAIDDPELALQFGADTMDNEHENYNLEGMYTGERAEPVFSEYDPELLYWGAHFVRDKMNEFILSDADVGEFLRSMHEEWEMELEEKLIRE